MESKKPQAENTEDPPSATGHSTGTQGGPMVYRTPDYIVVVDRDQRTFRLRTERARDPAWVLAWIRRLARNARLDRLTFARIIDVCENGAGLKLPDQSHR